MLITWPAAPIDIEKSFAIGWSTPISIQTLVTKANCPRASNRQIE
jgi:hypothetical protein